MCVPGPVTSVSGGAVLDLAIDATDVYFCGLESIYYAPKGGGAAKFLDQAPEPAAVTGIAIDATYVYWTDAGTSTSGGSIRKTPKAGGAPTTPLYQYAAGSSAKPFGVAVVGTSVYWSAQGDSDVGAAGHTRLGGTVNTDGTGATLLVKPDFIDHAVGRIAADAQGAFVVTGNAIYSFAGATLTGGTYALALDANYVYWSGKLPGTGTIGRTKRDNSTSGALVNNLTNPTGIAVDGTYVYWVDNTDGTVSSVPLAGGTVNKLASGQNGPNAIAVDATGIYWTTSDGKVMVLAK